MSSTFPIPLVSTFPISVVKIFPCTLVNRIPILEKLLYSFRKPIQERGNEKEKNVPKNTSF
ncbi:MAG: hypothetical protein DRH33_02610 [Candidatus Nealsonbacteria bacterium]|nr:MAG: hypothetical protein DRH33_02610 [Candidatus Nealsonbacteria bacterium]